MCITWAEYLSVGNNLIDSDHKKLIVAINNVAHAIETRDRAALSREFRLLNDLMGAHFINERKIAKAVNFPFDASNLHHLQLIDEIRYMITKIDSLSSCWPDSVVKMYGRYLSDWILEHIIKVDMKLKPVLKTHPYNFVSN